MAVSRRRFIRDLGLVGLGAFAACATPRVNYAPVQREEPPKPNFPRRTGRGRALIVNGDHVDPIHCENVLRAQKFLLGIGYGVDDITTLSAPSEAFVHNVAERIRREADYESLSRAEANGPATLKNADACLDKILRTLSPEQELFIYLTGHGWAENGSSYMGLNGRFSTEKYDKLTDFHLKEVLETGKFAQAVVLFDGCRGEGFSRNIGGGRITAIAKNKFENESACAFFAEYFFNTPWTGIRGLQGRKRIDADLNRDGVVHLQEAAQYADETIRRGGADSDLIITGEYNPALIPVKQAERFNSSTFMIFLPNSPIKIADSPPLEKIAAMDKVVKIGTEEQVRKALANPHACFYFHLDNCSPCSVVEPFMEEILQSSGAHPTLYIAAVEDGKASPSINGLAKHFNLELVFPLFVRAEEGKMVKLQRMLPYRTMSYGNLPDKTVEVVDRDVLRDYLL